MLEKVKEAELEDGQAGRTPQGDGWFVVNVAHASAMGSEKLGSGAIFEGRRGQFPEFGFNVRVLQPGQPNAMYHRETAQEACLVIRGECIAIVEDEERQLGPGDFLHLPAGTAHVLVGAGDEPCAVVMAGARKPDLEILYPVSAPAARYGASVENETSDRRVAYGDQPPPRVGHLGERPW